MDNTPYQARLKEMAATLVQNHGRYFVPENAIACCSSNLTMSRIYDELSREFGIQVEPMWILISFGPCGRYTRFLMRAKSFFQRPGPFQDWYYWDSLPSHGAMITYLEARDLCPWQR